MIIKEKNRLERSIKIAEMTEQKALVLSLEQDNLVKNEELSINQQLINQKNRSLVVLAVLCLVFVFLFIWLTRLLKKVRRLANTDGLTNISNRRHGLKQARKLIIKSKHKKTLGIAIFDLDHFKSVNDTYGHDIGDRVIQTAVSVIEVSLHKRDVFCRMGGEEFLVVIRGESAKEIFAKLDNIRKNIHQTDVDKIGLKSSISSSVGLTYMTPKDLGKTLTDYIIEADMALYDAKKAGRNQVRSYKNN